ncbi:MAG: FAD-binding oxidoreductase [Alphaproteobacteria bacterium]|nr:FAD-binding oxidoreductase [Alphaproteobacteria bacterium]
MVQTADVLIVGGGIIGACLAHGLTRRGARVVMLDQGRLGGGVTSTSIAWINATAKSDDPIYYRLNAAGVAAWVGLAEELGAAAIGYGGDGAVAWADGDDPALEDQVARLEALGHDLARVDAAAIADLAPGAKLANGAWGYRARADRWVDAPAAVARLAAAVRARGGVLREDTRVGTIRLSSGGVALETNRGAFAADRLVIAAGLATQELVALAAGPEIARMVPVRRDPCLLVDTPAQGVAAALRVHLVPPGPSGLHVRPMPGGGFRFGSDTAVAAITTRRGQPDATAAVAGLIGEAAGLYPDLAAPGLAAACSWRVGVRAIPGDGVSIAGAVPGADRLHVVVTHSGVTLAPLLGDLVAIELTGEPPSPLLAPYRPDRFITAA